MKIVAESLPKHYKPNAIQLEENEKANSINVSRYYDKDQEKQRADKRSRYGSLAREMYAPAIDERKRLEI
jgi:hypothetical protein